MQQEWLNSCFAAALIKYVEAINLGNYAITQLTHSPKGPMPMQIHLRTNVQQDYLTVFEGFDRQLFRQLAPPFPVLNLLRFDGSNPGDVVEVELQTGIKTFRWTSLITEREITASEAYFVDQGQELPPPLRFWRHKHLVTKAGAGAIIHDIITYSTPYSWLDALLYPVMLAQFAYRKPIYKKVFGKYD